MYEIKKIADDFKVEEILDLDINKGDHVYFLLEKKNWTTLKALQFIARKLHISAKRFHVAGMKDRRAVTTQYVSAYNIKRKNLEMINLKDIKIKVLGYGNKQIALGSLKENKFTIVVRNLGKEVSIYKKQVVPNYFDEQRFGGYRPNMHKVGKLILQNKFEDAVKTYLCYPFENETDDYKKARHFIKENWGKWIECRKQLPKPFIHERQVVHYLTKNSKDFSGALKALPKQLTTMFVQAYQAKLWNDLVSKYLKKYNGFYVDYSVGKLYFPEVAFEEKEIPMIGHNTIFEDREIEKIAKEIMEKENITFNFFKMEKDPLFTGKAIKRKMLIQTNVISKTKKDELNEGKLKQILEFKLPKGSFATIVIKKLFH